MAAVSAIYVDECHKNVSLCDFQGRSNTLRVPVEWNRMKLVVRYQTDYSIRLGNTHMLI